MFTQTYEARVFSHDHGDFRTVTNTNVLIYMPHGFGDWVQFSSILPLLNASNQYFMTRFGDDSSSIMEGSPFVTPFYLGHNSPHCNDGGDFGNRHFGINYDDIDGTIRRLNLPLALHSQCCYHQIEVIFWTSLPETWGEKAFPYHTKSRSLLPYLVSEEKLRTTNLSHPLSMAINFETASPNFLSLGASWLTRWVEARLSSYGGFGGRPSERKLCLIGRNGYTSIGKNWGHMFRDEIMTRDESRDEFMGGRLPEGQECRDFMRLMLQKDPNWMFLIMEDQLFEGNDTVRDDALNAYSYAQLFGTVNNFAPPFGLIIKTLSALADLAVGVPAGPYHLCMAKPDLPTVGIWIEHLPSWYDEPKDASIHVLSRNLHDRHLTDRPGSFLTKGDLHYRGIEVETRRITGEQVLSAVEMLLC